MTRTSVPLRNWAPLLSDVVRVSNEVSPEVGSSSRAGSGIPRVSGDTSSVRATSLSDGCDIRPGE